METILQQLTESAGGYLPKIIGAIVILIVGWIVALGVSAIVRRLLKKTSLDNKIAKSISVKSDSIEIENVLAKIVYYLIMLFVAMAVFVVLGLTQVIDPINNLLAQVLEFLPRFVGAGILVLVAWVIAAITKAVLSRALDSIKLDENLAKKANLSAADGICLSNNIAEVAYWLIFLLFLPAILGALGMRGILIPFQSLLNKFLLFVPHLLSAAIILLIGWFAARIVQKIVTSLLAATGVDKFADKIGLSKALGKQKISDVLGLLTYVIILIPIAIAALETLQLESLTRPASNMLNSLLEAGPAIFSATIILVISYVLARFVASFVTGVLGGVGFDNLPRLLGMKSNGKDRQKNPSELVGYLVIVYIMLFATLEACAQLHFDSLGELVVRFILFSTNILLAAVTVGVGLYIANLVANIIKDSGIQKSQLLSSIGRVLILILATSMALHQVGIAEEIVNLTFALLLGAVAVAVALSFGLGCRDIAARELDGWINNFKTKK